MSKCTGQKADKLEKDISRPYYFNPYSAIEYGIIDKASILLIHEENVLKAEYHCSKTSKLAAYLI